MLPVDQATLFPPWSAAGAPLPRNPNLNDTMTQFAPWAKAVRMAWKEGAPPLRNRWNGCGTPLAANGQSAAFSPFTFLSFLVPLANAFTLLAGLRLFLALLGMWLWLRELGVSPGAALFGSIAFAFSFSMTPWLLFSLPSVISLWPWCLFLVERLDGPKPTRVDFAALVLLLTLLPLSGHIESVVSIAGFAFVWFLTRALAGVGLGGRAVGRMALAAAAALGLSAFVLLPQALAILASNRFAQAQAPLWSAYFSLRPHAPAWPNGLWTTLFPRLLGDAVASPMIPGGTGSFPEMGLGYCGILSAAGMLLLLRPGGPRDRRQLALVAPTLFGLGVAIGAWPFAEIAGHLPLLRMMFPLRLFSWVALAAPAIAAIEIDRLRRDLAVSRRPLAAYLLATGALAALALAAARHFQPLHAATGGLDSQRQALVWSLAVLGTGAAAAVIASRSTVVLRALPFLLALFTAAELINQGQRLYRFGSPAALFPATPLTLFLARQPGPFRVVGEGGAVYPGTNIFAGVEDVRTHDAIERRDYVLFLDAAAGYPPAAYFKHFQNLDASVFDFLNVRYRIAAPGAPAPGGKWAPVYAGPDATAFENRRALPRAFAPGNLIFVPGRPGARSAADAFGPRFREIAKRDDWADTASVLAAADDSTPNGPAAVTDYRESVNEASFRVAVQAGAARALIVTSLVQDGGWSARDGASRSLEVTRANGPFLAIWVPAKTTSVHLSYQPPGFRVGTAISAAALLLLGFSLFATKAARETS